MTTLHPSLSSGLVAVWPLVLLVHPVQQLLQQLRLNKEEAWATEGQQD